MQPHQPKHAKQHQQANNTKKPEEMPGAPLAVKAKPTNKKIQPITLSYKPSLAPPAMSNRIAAPGSEYKATDSVNSNINQVVSQNGVLMQKAKAQAIEQKRAMGLQNSTLAINAAQDAVFNQAYNIARDDANIQSQKNLQANQFKQDDKNKAWQSSENLLNRQHDESQLNKQQSWQSNENTLSREHQNELEQLKHKNSLGLLDAQQKARLEELDKQQSWQSSENTLNREHDQSQLDKQQTWQSSENSLNREHQAELESLNRKHELGMLDIQGQQRLAELKLQAQYTASENAKNRSFELDKQRELVDAEFKKLGKELDANNKESYLKQSVQLRSSYDAIIQSIYSNPELKPEEQRTAIDREYQRYKSSLEDLYLSYQTLTGMNQQPVTGDNDSPNTSLPNLDNTGPNKARSDDDLNSRNANNYNGVSASQQFGAPQLAAPQLSAPQESGFVSSAMPYAQDDKQHIGLKRPGTGQKIGGFVDDKTKRATR